MDSRSAMDSMDQDPINRGSGFSGSDPDGHGARVSQLGKDPECREALDRLYHFLDGELTEERRREIEEHLRTCMPCLEAFDFEAELKLLIARRCRDEVPEQLRVRVAWALSEASVTLSAEREGPYDAAGSGGEAARDPAPGAKEHEALFGRFQEQRPDDRATGPCEEK
jgi:mycothiol system anti-sigma-R factor